MKRVFLFLLTNLAVMLVLGVVLSIIMSALGLSHRSLGGILLIATVFGFGGSFISLYMSKWIAKKSTGAQVIAQPSNQTEQWLVNTVAVQAKKAGKYANIKSPNAKKGIKKAKELNKLTGKKRFGALALGGAAGETLVGDTEEIGSFGDVFEAGPTQLDREVKEDSSEDAVRKLMNRTKFASESVFVTPFVIQRNQ